MRSFASPNAHMSAVHGLIPGGAHRPHRIEREAAERLIYLIPSAEMVKFGLNGSDATTAAVRLARAYTGRDVVAVCRQHSFFSTHDWFIVATPMSAGIPAAERLTVQLSTRLLYDIITIRRGVEVPRLPDITDTRVLLLIATADVGCAVVEALSGYDQFEVSVSLSKQGFK
jgi:hypothetical protein